MENELRLFMNEEFGTVRTLEENGTVLFCGTDVAKMLGYTNVSDALNRHCRCIVKRDIPHPQTGRKLLAVNFISEGDVYRLAARSELPEAARFEAWIFDEVLPAIRRTGMYATNQLLDDPDLALEAFAALKAERQKRLAAEEQLATCLPKVQYADAVCASRSSILVGDLAKLLKQNGVDIGQNRLFAYLRENGYLMRQGARRNMPTQKSMELGLFETRQTVIVSPGGSVRLSRTPKVTGKGQLYFIRHFQQRMS